MNQVCDMNSVRWISKDEIAFLATHLLEDYEGFSGKRVVAPIPIEDIIERYLKISLGYDDLNSMLNLSDVLGATWLGGCRKTSICPDVIGIILILRHCGVPVSTPHSSEFRPV